MQHAFNIRDLLLSKHVHNYSASVLLAPFAFLKNGTVNAFLLLRLPGLPRTPTAAISRPATAFREEIRQVKEYPRPRQFWRNLSSVSILTGEAILFCNINMESA